MSRALLKAQMEMMSDIAPRAQSDGQARARRKKSKRDKAKPATKKISREAKRASMHPLDRLRKELEVKDHTQDNITALNRRGDAKHRATADRQARKLAALRKPKRKHEQQDDESDDDEKRVDMWKVLRQMKKRGL
jgi:hypothetical protein